MSQGTDNDAVKQSLKKADLIPGPAEGLLGNLKPTVNLEVSYAGNVVELGTRLPASECKVAPAISFAAEVCRLLLRSIWEGGRGHLGPLLTSSRAGTWCWFSSLVYTDYG